MPALLADSAASGGLRNGTSTLTEEGKRREREGKEKGKRRERGAEKEGKRRERREREGKEERRVY